MDGWNTILSYWGFCLFSGGDLLVSGRVHLSLHKPYHVFPCGTLVSTCLSQNLRLPHGSHWRPPSFEKGQPECGVGSGSRRRLCLTICFWRIACRSGGAERNFFSPWDEFCLEVVVVVVVVVAVVQKDYGRWRWYWDCFFGWVGFMKQRCWFIGFYWLALVLYCFSVGKSVVLIRSDSRHFSCLFELVNMFCFAMRAFQCSHPVL